MTLRARLVAGLLALLTVGLVLFGVTSHRVFADAERRRFDAELRDAVPSVISRLDGFERGFAGPSSPGGPLGPDDDDDDIDGGDGGPPGPALAAISSFAQVHRGGALVAESPPGDGPVPDLGGVDADVEGATTVGSVGDDETRWRVVVDRGPDGWSAVVASPLDGVESTLRRLAAVQVVGGGLLLAALAWGAWLVVGRGLAPLEGIAATAGSIRAGSLDQRVAVDADDGEVGQLAGALNTMLDELEQAFREREATEARLRRFLADASHELRTPLTSIQGFAELLRIGGGEDAVDEATAVRRIEQESQRMRRLVDDLMLLARHDQGRDRDARRMVDLAVVAADACSDAAATDPDRPIHLDVPAPVVVLGDDDALRRAMGNLVTNALQHTPPGTRVHVVVRGGPTAVVTVRDHGGGIADSELEHVFDRFWQADPSRSGQGAGLGLAIVSAIASDHGGTVGVDNAPGGGACFTLRLPVAAAPPAPDRNRPPQRGSRST